MKLASKNRVNDEYLLNTKDSSDFVVISKDEEEKNGHCEPKISPTKRSRAVCEPLADISERKM